MDVATFHMVPVFAIQIQVKPHAPNGELVQPLILLVVAAVVGGLLWFAVAQTLPRLRRWIRAKRRQQRQLEWAAGAERRARAQMDELCPGGWLARLTLFATIQDLPDDAPRRHAIKVALDWAPVERRGADPDSLTYRRIWAGTIAEALERMVAERITEMTLAQIEHEALADGAEWPDGP